MWVILEYFLHCRFLWSFFLHGSFTWSFSSIFFFNIPLPISGLKRERDRQTDLRERERERASPLYFHHFPISSVESLQSLRRAPFYVCRVESILFLPFIITLVTCPSRKRERDKVRWWLVPSLYTYVSPSYHPLGLAFPTHGCCNW